MHTDDPIPVKENPPSADDKIKAAVFALWGRFQATMFARLSLIEQASGAALKGSLNDEQRSAAWNAAHKLAGSLGTFGLGEGSKLASQLEMMLEGGARFSPEESSRLKDLAEKLRQEMKRGPSPPALT
ncbi:MAG TPA: Hpt domain-containing protein [Terriglobia bacterium]|nr:Hpt domain-containing protein [Terriglobia bacterium]